jgi:hypothetical protein
MNDPHDFFWTGVMVGFVLGALFVIAYVAVMGWPQ